MSPDGSAQLTSRQRNEIAYHREHARRVAAGIPHTGLTAVPKSWNHYGAALSILTEAGVAGRRVLVPGCGAGFDAIQCALMGGIVTAIDLSPEMLQVAEAAAFDAHTQVEFLCMPVEDLTVPASSFDVIFIRDLLHHCDIERAISELIRVAKPGALFVIDELYTHTVLQRARESAFGRLLYSIVCKWIYDGEEPYITPDERKIDEKEFELVCRALAENRCEYWNTFVNRFMPDWDWAQILDRALTRPLGALGKYVAGRVLVTGRVPCMPGC